MKTADLNGKIVALFGCGDSESYCDTFCDGMGVIYDPVSYTHLDVYKRQRPYLSLNGPITNCPTASPTILKVRLSCTSDAVVSKYPASTGTVSYTHLDVYKRQVWKRLYRNAAFQRKPTIKKSVVC